MISKERRNYSNKAGRDAELKFKFLVEKRGNVVIESSEEENIYKHIDFWVNNKSVDVKGSRHLNCIWLEIKNVHGNKGWLESEVDYIAFDVEELESFCVFNRSDLLMFIQDNVRETAKDKTEFMKYYTRLNRRDVLVKVRYDDIKHLLIQKLNYATT